MRELELAFGIDITESDFGRSGVGFYMDEESVVGWASMCWSTRICRFGVRDTSSPILFQSE